MAWGGTGLGAGFATCSFLPFFSRFFRNTVRGAPPFASISLSGSHPTSTPAASRRHFPEFGDEELGEVKFEAHVHDALLAVSPGTSAVRWRHSATSATTFSDQSRSAQYRGSGW